MPELRPARQRDADAIWAILEPVLCAGDTFALPRRMTRQQALDYWMQESHEVFVAEDQGLVVGTCYLRANQAGGGAHVANCGYITAPSARGKGIARSMCVHSLARARQRRFRAMQFNFVVSTNRNAVHLWQSLGFLIVGTLPEAFLHPTLGYVDALVMYRKL